ncbi:MAG: metallophosphoesterase [Candidatus Obscuribacterales bacterium]|nr:metallophosphoesterase [Candidatus Obscuribacterales bacterium]
MPPKSFKLVIISDVHKGDDKVQDGRLQKLPSRALSYLRYLVNRINTEIQPDFVMQLGNLIEAEDAESDEENYDTALGVFRQISVPVYHAVGSHEQENLSLKQISSMLKYSKLYYSFDSGPFHFVVLFARSQKNEGIHIDEAQRKWLEQDLISSHRPTLVFVHHPIDEQDLSGNFWFEQNPEQCFVSERAEIRAILARSGNVLAVFSGHVHRNNLESHDNIYYVTIQSLVENMSKTGKTASESFAIVTLKQDEICVEVEGVDPAEYRLSAQH